MVYNNHKRSGLGVLAGQLGRTALWGINTRVELLAVEWQEERLRLRDLLVWSIALLFLGIVGALLLTAAIIFLFPEGTRVYVTAALAVLYLFGALGVWLGIKSDLKRQPFTETIEQVKKDRVWLESIK
jgi:uncharacterized membrane protein YqjE